MPKNIKYVTCPKCKGEFYVTKTLFEQKDIKYFCPFCQSEFTPIRKKEE